MKRESAFWDSSALVPLCVRESSTQFARQQLRRYLPVVWWGASVEVQSAISRLHRSAEISDKVRHGADARLEMLKRGWTEILPDDELRALAENLLTKYVLRAADSFQLAAALAWCSERPANRKFLCADERLTAAATNAGFAVVKFP